MYTIYKTINTQTSQFYIGVHKTHKPDDWYLGSGLHLNRAISKYGREIFQKIILESYDDRTIAYKREKELLEVALKDPLCYNIKQGGIGGFDYIHKHPECNCMKNPGTVEKIKKFWAEKRRLQGLDPKSNQISSIGSSKTKYETAIENLKKATAANLGKKRPEHAILVREQSKKRWAENKEFLRDCLASTFMVTAPDGTTYKTNRLEQFCKDRGLAYTSLWATSNGKPITKKGRSAGWSCLKVI